MALQPKTYHADIHDIDYRVIDADALWVVHKLREAGFETYLVGGSVRDLLTKITPKDYDISTSALPEQIKAVFGRRCLIIGRRFRLAHIRFGHKILEVSTFRSGENDDELIVRDNQWGTPEEDVLRRDFTINGMFYDPENHTVIDYVGGWEDIHNKILRSIGDPVVRFRQDPVRMIRLLKFKARFGYHICEQANAALQQCVSEITKSAPARILEEILRMLESGYATPFIKLMSEFQLLNEIFPTLTYFLNGPRGKEIYALLAAADQLNKSRDRYPLDRAILASCLIYPILDAELKRQFLDQGRMPHMGDIIMLTNSVLQSFITSSFSHFPKRLSASMAYVLTTQYRLTPLSPKQTPKRRLLDNPEFSLALHFLRLRSLLDDKLFKVYTSWKNSQRQHSPRKED